MAKGGLWEIFTAAIFFRMAVMWCLKYAFVLYLCGYTPSHNSLGLKCEAGGQGALEK